MSNEPILTCERVPDTLDDYSGGRLPAGMQAAVDAHVAACPACQALVADVRAIRAVARTLGSIEPPERVWRNVRARVGADSPPRALAWRTVFQPLAAAAALALVVSGLSWVGVRLTEMRPPAATADVTIALAGFELAEAEYTDAIARLEEAADAARPRLDALTSETLRSSIDDIEIAIGDARDALEREPDDALSQEHLLDALGSKVALLQDTVAMLGDIEPGTEEQIQ